MSSGVGVNDSVVDAFQSLRRTKSPKWAVFKIDSDRVVEESRADEKSGLKELVESLPENECRFAVFDHNGVTNEGSHKSKIFFIAWSPDSAGIKNKMVYASTKDTLKQRLEGVQLHIQATDYSEIEESAFVQKAGF